MDERYKEFVLQERKIETMCVSLIREIDRDGVVRVCERERERESVCEREYHSYLWYQCIIFNFSRKTVLMRRNMIGLQKNQ